MNARTTDERKETNVETVQELYSAFAAGDMEYLLSKLTEDVDWITPDGYPYGGHSKGPDAVLEEVFAPIAEEWETFEVHPERFVDGGETVVSIGVYRGTYRGTGESFEAPYAHVWDFSDGDVARFQQFTDTLVVREALE